ncbi:MAG: InlB B-repeat-containing protein [Clostridiales bacterium]|nr:InlB B-repeat-containing protein [Clostridiales bacterium]
MSKRTGLGGRITAILLSIIMVMGCFVMPVSADETYTFTLPTIEGIEYQKVVVEGVEVDPINTTFQYHNPDYIDITVLVLPGYSYDVNDEIWYRCSEYAWGRADYMPDMSDPENSIYTFEFRGPTCDTQFGINVSKIDYSMAVHWDTDRGTVNVLNEKSVYNVGDIITIDSAPSDFFVPSKAVVTYTDRNNVQQTEEFTPDSNGRYNITMPAGNAVIDVQFESTIYYVDDHGQRRYIDFDSPNVKCFGSSDSETVSVDDMWYVVDQDTSIWQLSVIGNVRDVNILVYDGVTLTIPYGIYFAGSVGGRSLNVFYQEERSGKIVINDGSIYRENGIRLPLGVAVYAGDSRDGQSLVLPDDYSDVLDSDSVNHVTIAKCEHGSAQGYGMCELSGDDNTKHIIIECPYCGMTGLSVPEDHVIDEYGKCMRCSTTHFRVDASEGDIVSLSRDLSFPREWFHPGDKVYVRTLSHDKNISVISDGEDVPYEWEDDYIISFTMPDANVSITTLQGLHNVDIGDYENGGIRIGGYFGFLEKDVATTQMTGNQVMIEVLPDEDYRLLSLTVTTDNGTITPVYDELGHYYVFEMPDSDVTVNPVFALAGGSYVITIPEVEHLQLTVDKPTARRDELVEIIAIPDRGYSLKSLSFGTGSTTMDEIDISGGGNIFHIIMPNNDITINATVEGNTYSIADPSTDVTYQKSDDYQYGILSCSQTSAAVGEEVIINSTIKERWNGNEDRNAGLACAYVDYEYWDATGNRGTARAENMGDGTFRFIMPESDILGFKTHFAYPLILEVPEGHGSIYATVNNSTDHVEWVDYGSQVEIHVTPDDGYTFTGLDVTQLNGNSVNWDPDALTVSASDSAITVNASFEKTYAITPIMRDHLSIAVNPARAVAGEDVTVTLSIEDGYEVEDELIVRVNGERASYLGNSRYGFTMPSKDVAVSVEGNIIESDPKPVYNITQGEGITCDRVSAHTDDVITVTVNEPVNKVCTGVYYTYWGGQGTQERTVEAVPTASGTYTFSMPASNATVYAEYADCVYYINDNGEKTKVTGCVNITTGIDTLSGEWYYIDDSSDVPSSITVTGSDVNIILVDGVHKSFSSLILGDGSALHIWSQDKNTGKITVINSVNCPAGSSILNIHGGTFTVETDNIPEQTALQMYDGAKVWYAEQSQTGRQYGIAPAADRIDVCKNGSTNFVRITPCDHPNGTYTTTNEYHIFHCDNCLLGAGQQEQHNFVNGVCECGGIKVSFVFNTVSVSVPDLAAFYDADHEGYRINLYDVYMNYYNNNTSIDKTKYTFNGWSADGESYPNGIVFIDSSKTFVADITKKGYKRNVYVRKQEHATVTLEQTYGYPGDRIYLTIVPDEGYEVATKQYFDYGAYGNPIDISSGNTYYFTIPSNQYASNDIAVEVTASKRYNITKSWSGTGGSIICDSSALAGNTVGFRLYYDDSFYGLASYPVVLCNGEEIETNISNYDGSGRPTGISFTMPEGDVSITAAFGQYRNVYIPSDGTVSVTSHSNLNKVPQGSRVEFTVTPPAGKYVQRVSVTGSSPVVLTPLGGENYAFTMPSYAATIEVEFVDAVTISYDANGGSNAPADIVTRPGIKYYLPVCEITPPTGQTFDHWEIDGVETPINTPITINEDITVKAVWKSTWESVQEGMNQGGTIVLLNDLSVLEGQTTNTSFIIPAAIESVLDLNGHTIDFGRGANGADDFAVYIAEGASFTIDDNSTNKDGSLINFKAEASAIENHGDFILNAGTITGGTGLSIIAIESDGDSVAVNGGTITQNATGVVIHSGSFTMTGGTISENTGSGGCGLFLDGVTNDVEAHISGGTITGNGSDVDNRELYGGVILQGDNITLGLSGDPVITGNYCGKNTYRENNNIYFPNNGDPINIEGELTSEALIGIHPHMNMGYKPLTSGLNGKGDLSNFSMDVPGDSFVLDEDGELIFAYDEFVQGYYVVLDGRIGLVLRSCIHSNDENLSITFEGNCSSVSEPQLVGSYGGNNYGIYETTAYFKSIDIAEEVIPVITFTYDGEEYTYRGNPYSIQQYINDALETGSITEGSREESIVHSLGAYGYYAQQYLSVQNNWTIGEDHAAVSEEFATLTDNDIAAATEALAGHKVTKVKDDATFKNVYYRMSFNDTVDLEVRVVPAAGVTVDSVTVGGEEIPIVNGIATIDNIYASRLTNEYTVQIGNGSITISPYTYLNNRIKSGGPERDMAAALWLFAEACKPANG